jgi:RNA polymerase sigma factor (sigma-70 family)
MSNVYHVVGLAVRYRHLGNAHDFISNGIVGLIEAIRMFDPGRGLRLWPLARSYAIDRSMAAYTVKTCIVACRGGVFSHRWFWRVKRALRRAELDGCSEWEMADAVAKHLGVSLERADRFICQLMAHGSPILDDDADEALRVDNNPEDELISIDESRRRKARIEDALQSLTPGQRAVTLRRLYTDEPETGARTAISLGITKQRVNQIERRAKAKLAEQLATI